jgi:UDP-N-acetylglucosamine acyltransferase
MSISPSARVHPTALLSPEVELGDEVQVGAYAVLEGAVKLGPGCVIRPFAHLIGPITMGPENHVFTGVVIGEAPQHLRYAGEPTGVEIGAQNIFREHVTIHRGTTQSWNTRIGDRNFFMAQSHVAHDCHIGNNCTLVNGALLGGHCILEDGVIVSGNSVVHQFVRMGRLSMLSGVSGTSKDVPPFVVQQSINTVMGVNVVGMRRAGMTSRQIDGVRQAYHILYRHSLTIPNALAQIERELGHVDSVVEMVTFIRRSTRGINLPADPNRLHAA